MSNISNISSSSAPAKQAKIAIAKTGTASKAKNVMLLQIARAPMGTPKPQAGLLIASIPKPLGKQTQAEHAQNLKTMETIASLHTANQQVLLDKISDPAILSIANKTLGGKLGKLDAMSVKAKAAASANGDIKLDLNDIRGLVTELNLMIDKMPQAEYKAFKNELASGRDQIKSTSAKKLKKLEESYKKAEAAAAKEKWMKVLGWAAAIATVVVGAVLIATGAGAIIGGAILAAGVVMIAKQAVSQFASKKFLQSKTGKWLNFALTAAAGVAMVVAAVATGGASLLVGVAVVGILGGVTVQLAQTIMETGTKKQQAEDKEDQKKHVWMALDISFAALGLAGGVGAGMAASGASSAAEAAKVADTSAQAAETVETAASTSQLIDTSENASHSADMSSSSSSSSETSDVNSTESPESLNSSNSQGPVQRAKLALNKVKKSITEFTENLKSNEAQSDEMANIQMTDMSNSSSSPNAAADIEASSVSTESRSFSQKIAAKLGKDEEGLSKTAGKVQRSSQYVGAGSGIAKGGLGISIAEDRLGAERMQEASSEEQAKLTRVNAFMNNVRSAMTQIVQLQKNIAENVREISQQASQTSNAFTNLS